MDVIKWNDDDAKFMILATDPLWHLSEEST